MDKDLVSSHEVELSGVVVSIFRSNLVPLPFDWNKPGLVYIIRNCIALGSFFEFLYTSLTVTFMNKSIYYAGHKYRVSLTSHIYI